MICQDEQLKVLQEQVDRRHKLDRKKQQLFTQQTELRHKVRELDSARIKEQNDVDKLEGHSLAAFFYKVIGKMGEQLDEERAEAYAAAVKYDAALRELEDVEYDLKKTLEEYNSLANCETDYVRALNAKTAALKAAGGAVGQQILKLEQELAVLNRAKKEIKEALLAGNSALSAANAAQDELQKASKLATWDMLGGGLLVDMNKHEALDRAQLEVVDLQNRLRRFRTELYDVNLSADFHVNLDGFTQFADWFFDGLFVDWTVSDQISRSQKQVTDVSDQLQQVLSRLRKMEDNTERKIRQHQADLDKLVLGSSV